VIGREILIGTRIQYFYVLNQKSKQKILTESHNSPMAEYSRFLKTYQRIKKQFFGEGMKKRYSKFVREFFMCPRNIEYMIKTLQSLQPLHIPNQIWE
jgi:hypothetical protein